ncbi:unnamed protein product [Caenorhabditis bovis]|uniref:Uncharacterized protein n=1 Tax=Caenorhabditis bovis TaxID=2654633 RepID=A0A8S1EDD5_9PELO|nr:unnamed protein product [Caenorhabditis bovis]
MIAARQISKPIADAVIKYGKEHPLFRNKLLIPIGKGLVRFTARLRMKRLGLGEPVAHAPISEAAALEQASDFVQQIVLFSYSVSVFAGYYFYTKYTTPETLKAEEFEKYKEQQEQIIKGLRFQLETLEQRLNAQSKRSFLAQIGVVKDSEKTSPASATPPTPPTAPSNSASAPSEEKSENKSSWRSRFQRVSSLPIDSAASLILDDEEYLIVRRGSSIGIELSSKWAERGEKLRYRLPEGKPRISRIDGFIDEAAYRITGGGVL